MRSSIAARPVAVLVLLVGLLAGCSAAAPPATSASPGPPVSAFEGPHWSAIVIDGQPPVPGHEPTIQFVGGQVRGSGGCNQFSGAYRYDAATGSLQLSGMAMTAMGCLDQRIGAVESAFSEVIGAANRLDLDADGRLHLTGPAGEVVCAKMVEG